MWVVNGLPYSTNAQLYDLQSERAQAVALRVLVFVERRKWRNGCVQGDMKLDTLVEFLFSHAVSSRLEWSNKLVLLLVQWVSKCFLQLFLYQKISANKRHYKPMPVKLTSPVVLSDQDLFSCLPLNVRLPVQRNRTNVKQHKVWLCSAVMFCLWKK